MSYYTKADFTSSHIHGLFVIRDDMALATTD